MKRRHATRFSHAMKKNLGEKTPLYNSHGNETIGSLHLASVRLLSSSVEKTTRNRTSKPRGEETMTTKTRVAG
ncbi:hypothetical protein Bca101_018507 [Brassica carinata]